jgi:hypothetical protein
MRFDEIKVGDSFKYKSKDGAVYDFEVTRKDNDSYIIQARTMTKNGKSVGLFGPAHITTLVKDDAEFGGVRMSQTFGWYRKDGESNE